MEPVKLLVSGLTLEESKTKRQEKQAARYRHRLGTYVPSGDNGGLLEALMATSPRKSPTPRRSVAPDPKKRGKPVKKSTRDNDEVVDDSTRESEKPTKLKKPTVRKSIRATDTSEEKAQDGWGDRDVSRRPESNVREDAAKDGVEEEPKPSTSRRKKETKVNSKTTKSKKSAVVTTPKRPKSLPRNIDAGLDFDDQLPIPERSRAKPKKTSAKPLPTQTDEESDDMAIKATKVPWQTNKRKVTAMDSPPETSESPRTEVVLEDSRPGPSNTKLPSIEKKVPGSNRRFFSGEQHKPPPKKRGHPRYDEEGDEPSPKRGKSNGNVQDKRSATTGLKQRSKKSSPKPRSGRTGKNIDPQPELSDVERDDTASSETKTTGSNTRKHQHRAPHDVSDDEWRSEPDPDEVKSNPNRVRLDTIPPDGIVIRKKNGIVEKLLPPLTKPKRRAPITKGKTRGSLRRAIPAHVLKYIGPTRFGSPLKAEGTDTDDDLNL